MTNEPVFQIDIELVEQFLDDQDYPPLTPAERSDLSTAFCETVDQYPIIGEAIRFLRGNDCGVSPGVAIESVEQLPSLNGGPR